MEHNRDSAGFTGGENEDFTAGESFLKFQTRPSSGGEFRVGDDDGARLDGIEQGFAEGFGLRGQAGDDDVGTEAIGFTVE